VADSLVNEPDQALTTRFGFVFIDDVSVWRELDVIPAECSGAERKWSASADDEEAVIEMRRQPHQILLVAADAVRKDEQRGLAAWTRQRLSRDVVEFEAAGHDSLKIRVDP
jgi:hypothetical protein